MFENQLPFKKYNINKHAKKNILFKSKNELICEF